MVQEILLGIENASSRFRADSELETLRGRMADGVAVSPRLASLVEAAIKAARWTDGSVDPTLGNDIVALGYDRDIDLVRSGQGGTPATVTVLAEREPGWRRIGVNGGALTVPNDLALDLGASAKAVAADECANAVADALHCGVLVSLGGDIATAGNVPPEGWQVLVQDTPSDPAQTVSLAAGHAIATSSTQKRRWSIGAETHHHILDPLSGTPAEPVWRSVTVAAETCLYANALSTASVIRGHAAVEWLSSLGATARLVDQFGRIETVGGWPTDTATGGT